MPWRWIAAFLALAAVAPTGAGRAADAWARNAVTPLLHAVPHAADPALALGEPLVAGAVFLLLTLNRGLSWRERWSAWGLWVAAGAIEIGCKAVGLGGAGAPIPLYPLPTAVAHEALRLWPGLQRVLGVRLRGTFPSGHVLRLTLAAGYVRSRGGPWLPLVVAAISGILVMGSGAHHLTGVLGGAVLGCAALAAAGRMGGRAAALPRP